MLINRCIKSLVSLLVIVFICSGLSYGAGNGTGPYSWQGLNPADIHKQLAKGKAQSLLEERARQEMAQGTADVTQTNYDVLFYDVFIRVNDTTEILYGKVGFDAMATQSGVGEVQVDLYSTMLVDSIVAPDGPLSFTRLGNVVTVALDSSYRSGEYFSFNFFYSGHPTEGGFQAFEFLMRNGYPVMTTLSEPYFARTWWPCKDRMDDKPDSMKIAIEVDTALYVGSNGVLDSTILTSDNTHTYYYTEHYPIATYLFSLAISNYTVWEDVWTYNGGQINMPIVNAVYPDWYSYSLTHLNVTPTALTVFSDLFGLYPFTDEKYGHSNFNWGGAMEHQTMTSTTASSFGFSTPVVVHELSHQWWGDMITCESWHDIWLNEGWASYCEALYYLETEGWGSYHSYMAGMDYTSGGTIYCQDTTDVWSIFSTRVYDKGAWALHMLRRVMGDSLFFEGVHDYYASAYQYGSATTEDFRQVLEGASGMDLGPFFEDWIYGEYRPNYNWSWMSEPANGGGYDVYIRVNQVQTTNPQVFHMPVDFYLSGPNDTVTFLVDERQTRLRTHTSVDVTSIALDPEDWVMHYSTVKSWQLYIISLRDDLDTAIQYNDYSSPVEYRGGSGSFTWSITGGQLPSGLTIDQWTGVISGSTPDTGSFSFTVKVEDNIAAFTDEVDFTMYVTPTPLFPGDVNHDGEITVEDLTRFVDYFFLGGTEPLVLNDADVDGSCAIDVEDLTYLVAYLFLNGPVPLIGCVM